MNRLIGISFLCLAAGGVSAAVEIDSRSPLAGAVEVALSTAQTVHVSTPSVSDQGVRGYVEHVDPMVVFDPLLGGKALSPKTQVVEITLQRHAGAQSPVILFFATDRTPGFAGDRMVSVPAGQIPNDGKAHRIRIDVGAQTTFKGRLTALRIDPYGDNDGLGKTFVLSGLKLGTSNRPPPFEIAYTPVPLSDYQTPVPVPQAFVEEAGKGEPLRAIGLRCEYQTDPLGIDVLRPRLQWQLSGEGTGRAITAWQVQAGSRPGGADLWDTGKVAGNTQGVAYAGKALGSGGRVHWRVRVWEGDKTVSPWSESASWTMGLLAQQDRSAQWISFHDPSPVHTSQQEDCTPPSRLYRNGFTASKPIQRAVATVTGLGVFDVWCNGKRVHETYFMPGWSDYKKRVHYRTLDVTAYLQQGKNMWGAELADGWYAGYVGYGQLVGYGPHKTGRNFYGKTPALWMQLDLTYTDGSTERVGTSTDWQTRVGPRARADMLKGEHYDARADDPNWCTTAGTPEGWSAVIPAAAQGSIPTPAWDRRGDFTMELGFEEPPVWQAYASQGIEPVLRVPAVRKHQVAPDTWIFDLGQNIAGVVELKVKGDAGTAVRLRHGEMLHLDGRLMTENLRKADATDVYTLRGDSEGEVWSPRFTYHGFQFVEVKGYPGEPPLEAITGIVVQSDTPMESAFTCSDPMVNRLAQNIAWTQRGNFVEVPTDCPQRDERLGWTGDAQAYIQAACYNADVAAFFTKWMDDLEEAQQANGAFPAYAPFPMQHGIAGSAYGSAWMDAGVICPWTIWRVYGDKRIVVEHWESMTRFMDFRLAFDPKGEGKKVGNPWGDWLSVGGETPVPYIDAIYGALVTRMMAEMAQAIGRDADEARYRKRLAVLEKAFAETWTKGQRLTVETQTAYALAICTGLGDTEAYGNRLVQLVAEAGGKMTTGFLGTRFILPALTRTGHHDVAIELLQARHYPSWGYEVMNGATTIWERWNSFVADEGFGNPAMNSFSHYAFGAVSEWMYRDLAGIDTATPGFAKMVIRPRPPSPQARKKPGALTWVRAVYAGPRGQVVSAWQVDETGVAYTIRLPANTTASVELPDGTRRDVGSGVHHFRSK